MTRIPSVSGTTWRGRAHIPVPERSLRSDLAVLLPGAWTAPAPPDGEFDMSEATSVAQLGALLPGPLPTSGDGAGASDAR